MTESQSRAVVRRDRGLRLSIPTKIFLAFSFILVLFASVLAYNLTRLNRLYDEANTISRGLFPFRVELSDIETDLRSYAALVSERDPVALRDAVLANRVLYPFARQIEARLAACQSILEDLASQELATRHVEGFRRLHQSLDAFEVRAEVMRTRSETLERLLAGESFSGLERIRHNLAEILAQMERQVRTISVTTDTVVNEALAWASQREQGSVLVVAVTSTGALLVALLVMLWAARILRPLTRLIQGVQTLKGGRFETVMVQARNEIGDLAEEFNQLVGALEERDRRLREGRRALERAHQIALEAEGLAAMGRLTSQITHEIRNPLSSIGLNIELLDEEIRNAGGDHGEALELIRSIHKEIDRLTSITHEYLQFARLPEPRPAATEVNDLIEEVTQFHAGELSLADVQLVLDLDPNLPVVHVDPGQLRQAVLNLVRNAREAMPDGGRLVIATSVDEAAISVAVEDEGEGVAEDARERIFDPFFTTKSQGTGLGLPLTRRIVDQHGGEIRCSEGTSGGARFVIRLPRQPAPSWPGVRDVISANGAGEEGAEDGR